MTFDPLVDRATVAVLEAVLALHTDGSCVLPEQEYAAALQTVADLGLEPRQVALVAEALRNCNTSRPVPPSTAVLSGAEVQALVDRSIRQHELRVAVISGLIGLLLLAGTWHAIWLSSK